MNQLATEFRTGRSIKKIRLLKEFKQEDIAQKSGMSQQKYSKIERGETAISDDELTSIAKALEVDKEYITSFDENSIFSNCHINNAFAYNGTYHNYMISPELKNLYEHKISTLEELIKVLEDENKKLKRTQ